ncbi:hypothetical protein NG796_07095 [Laspinema sp. A4]|uniref:hypothetical protein n=1 Tax=Laspinema sp. D2d TaxID=2953686 RepID=UPI0021BA5087|nr:hypothetical protein [Laspinema sp. D2d]MCT7983056.1 hypothetical protein [Laspinema sp. D2d]
MFNFFGHLFGWTKEESNSDNFQPQPVNQSANTNSYSQRSSFSSSIDYEDIDDASDDDYREPNPNYTPMDDYDSSSWMYDPDNDYD